MHHFVAEMEQLQIGAAAVFLRRAESVYDENLSSYVKIVLRRPFAKIIVSSGLCAILHGLNYLYK
jgi:exocyst complex component 1